jgi:putative membrane protein
MRPFTGEEERQISDAIAMAESTTAGEIVVVVAGRSDSYLYVPPLVAALLSLLVPWVLIVFTQLSLEATYLAQLGTFLLLTIVLLPFSVRIALVPGRVKRRHAHARAIEQFLAQCLHTTAERTGVLIFVSVAEHYVEILADSAIDERVPAGTWKRIVDDLTATIGSGEPANGLIAAVEAAGRHLSQHFPPDSANPNELPDHLIVLP